MILLKNDYINCWKKHTDITSMEGSLSDKERMWITKYHQIVGYQQTMDCLTTSRGDKQKYKMKETSNMRTNQKEAGETARSEFYSTDSNAKWEFDGQNVECENHSKNAATWTVKDGNTLEPKTVICNNGTMGTISSSSTGGLMSSGSCCCFQMPIISGRGVGT